MRYHEIYVLRKRREIVMLKISAYYQGRRDHALLKYRKKREGIVA
jgi:hypothetical protein